jgi:hypothetical protein
VDAATISRIAIITVIGGAIGVAMATNYRNDGTHLAS